MLRHGHRTFAFCFELRRILLFEYCNNRNNNQSNNHTGSHYSTRLDPLPVGYLHVISSSSKRKPFDIVAITEDDSSHEAYSSNSAMHRLRSDLQCVYLIEFAFERIQLWMFWIPEMTPGRFTVDVFALTSQGWAKHYAHHLVKLFKSTWDADIRWAGSTTIKWRMKSFASSLTESHSFG